MWLPPAPPAVFLGAPLSGGDSSLRERMVEGVRIAMEAVMAAEKAFGHEPRDVSARRISHDIESRESSSGRLKNPFTCDRPA